jgi:hypothetical protein
VEDLDCAAVVLYSVRIKLGFLERYVFALIKFGFEVEVTWD